MDGGCIVKEGRCGTRGREGEGKGSGEGAEGRDGIDGGKGGGREGERGGAERKRGRQGEDGETKGQWRLFLGSWAHHWGWRTMGELSNNQR